MSLIFYLLAASLIALSYRSFRGGIDYLRYIENELARLESSFAPFVSVIVPCRGVDQNLQANLTALREQAFRKYELIFVVDSTLDLALPVIEHAKAATADAKIVVASPAFESGQKVENLREAVQHADPRSQVFVFVDSDARPAKDWLRHLVAPLRDEKIGATTGYRWFISEKPSFASELRSVWNASIASALGPNRKSNFCWGGSMAIRRDTFEKLDMRERWRGTLSDDFAMTRAVKEAGLEIYFVPQALSASVENCTFRELFEFTNRQMKITRVYASHLWRLSFFGSGLFTTVMLASFLILIFNDSNNLAVWAAIITIVLVSIFSIGKSWLRLKAVKLAMPQYEQELKRQALPQLTLWMLSPFLFLYNCIAAALSRRMRWRGIEYEMVSPTETKVTFPGPPP